MNADHSVRILAWPPRCSPSLPVVSRSRNVCATQAPNEHPPSLTVMLFYDIAITFGDEVERIWKQRFTGATILWFLVSPLGNRRALLPVQDRDSAELASPIDTRTATSRHSATLSLSFVGPSPNARAVLFARTNICSTTPSIPRSFMVQGHMPALCPIS